MSAMGLTDDPTADFLRAVAEAAAGLDPTGLEVAELRARSDELTAPVFRAYAEDGPEVAGTLDVVVDEGLRARVYLPFPDATGELPSLHLFLHGGGWWQGTIDSWIVDAQSRERCAGGHAVVVSLEYRKAPEHPFPSAVRDCHRALAWMAGGPAELGPHRDRLTISGVSAGANLAAAAVLVAQAEGPAVHHQILEALPADLRIDQPTSWQGPDGTGINRHEFAGVIDLYLPDVADAEHPWASPLLHDDLAGLPPATVLIGERDPLRDGAVAYAERLAAAGVDVRLRRFPDFVHHTPIFTRRLAEARSWRGEVLDAIAGRGRP